MFSVIFDMDGTLLDTQRICIPAWDYAGEKQGFKDAGQLIPSVCGMNESGYTDCIVKKYPCIDAERFKKDAREYIIKNGVVRYKKGAEELLIYLKKRNIKLGLASGSSRNSIDHHLKEVGAEGIFDAIIGSHDVENGKPAPDVFLKTAEIMGVCPKDCFVFEDSPNGIKAGFLAGMRCIGIEDIIEFGEETKKMMYLQLNDLSEAIKIFENELY